MVKGVGIDIQATSRIEALLARYDSELQMVFTSGELERATHSAAPAKALALCFSTKEAMSKALGTGIGAIDWREIEAEAIVGGQIRISLSGKALRQAQSLAATGWSASWSAWEGQVLVTVVVE